MKRPLIGLTSIYNIDRDSHVQYTRYLRALWQAGADTVMFPTAPDTEAARSLIAAVDGFLVPGGPDVCPHLYGEQPIPQVPAFRASEDRFEIALIKEAHKQGKPVLAICRGMQVVNVAFGGSLYQDIPTQFSREICHRQSTAIRNEPTHLVVMDTDSRLGKIFKDKEFYVNSYHHQGVKKVADEFKIVGRATDGMPEAMENADGSILAVQWHPECLTHIDIFRDLFTDFVNRCKK